MEKSFYFYDLETSGVSPKNDRIMQFAGQRTNENLEPIGEPTDLYIKFSKDVMPQPDAVMLTGITPQKTIQEGITEAEFTKYFEEEVAEPGTIFVGFNNIRFDDEFIRYIMYRNYHDPYEWHWKDGRSRWDILDVIRMTRALRPDGIFWPFDKDGKSTNKLESLTAVNNLNHENAHTALSDVNATISIAKLIMEKQPKLFKYLMNIREKSAVRNLVTTGEPFAYVSGKYESQYEKMTVAVMAKELPDKSGALVYDLRYNPDEWANKSDDELLEATATFNKRSENQIAKLPFKTLQYNKCPSVAPYSVVNDECAERLSINREEIASNFEKLQSSQDLIERVARLLGDQKKAFQASFIPDISDPDTMLYDGFIPDADRAEARRVAHLGTTAIKGYAPDFEDNRLNALFPLYKARNFPGSLNDNERQIWEDHVARRLFEGSPNALEKFYKRLGELFLKDNLTTNQQYILQELKLYVESITPAD